MKFYFDDYGCLKCGKENASKKMSLESEIANPTGQSLDPPGESVIAITLYQILSVPFGEGPVIQITSLRVLHGENRTLEFVGLSSWHEVSKQG